MSSNLFDCPTETNARPARRQDLQSATCPPRRDMPFDEEPGFYEPARLWLFGNARLLRGNLVTVDRTFGPPHHSPADLQTIETETEQIILAGGTLVSGVHSPAHQRSAIVPLRWGAPRILVLSGGFKYHLGEDLRQEPFRAARLWRYQWDPKTDLAISWRSPEKQPTFARHNPTVDRLILRIVQRSLPGLLFEATP